MAVVVGFLVTPAARHDVAEASSSAVVQRVWACQSGRSDIDPRSTAVFFLLRINCFRVACVCGSVLCVCRCVAFFQRACLVVVLDIG